VQRAFQVPPSARAELGHVGPRYISSCTIHGFSPTSVGRLWPLARYQFPYSKAKGMSRNGQDRDDLIGDESLTNSDFAPPFTYALGPGTRSLTTFCPAAPLRQCLTMSVDM